MFTTIVQLLSGSASAKQTEMFPRQINLSGNIFHFSMPEDFSKDMPAADMVERLDISDSKKFDNPEYGNLIRRWWDIKTPGWFGKELGVVMMDISVQRVPENRQKILHKNPYDIAGQLDFMLVLNEQYHQRYDKTNKEIGKTEFGINPYETSFASMYGKKIESGCRDYVFNNQKWIQQGITAPREDLIYILSIPLTQTVYLEATFTYSKNDNVNLREFREAAFAKMKLVQSTFKVDYAVGNVFEKIVGKDWLEHTNDEVLEQHRESIVKLFYGPDGEKALLENIKKSQENYKQSLIDMREENKSPSSE